MSFPDQTQPPHPAISSPFSSGDPAAFWQPYWQPPTDHHHPPSDPMAPQFDNRPPLKKHRPSENPPHFPQPNPRINPPNAANKGTSHIFYKTRMCAKFIEGTCKNGEHCTFAHGPADLREPPPNWQEIVQKDRGAISGAGNNNWGGGGGDDQRMMIHRMKICKKYYNGEECPYGEKCNFLHERPSTPPMVKRMKVENNVAEQRESFAISLGASGEFRGSGGGDFVDPKVFWKTRMCSKWEMGNCPFGDRCHYGGSGGGDFVDPKVFWKTRMCSKWEMGNCPFGDRCHYAHGQSELKYSGNVDEAEQVVMNAMMASNIPRNPSSISAFSNTPPPSNLAAPVNGNGENKASKWKLTKKINRIYADWLDDATPPHLSPNEERVM